MVLVWRVSENRGWISEWITVSGYGGSVVEWMLGCVGWMSGCVGDVDGESAPFHLFFRQVDRQRTGYHWCISSFIHSRAHRHTHTHSSNRFVFRFPTFILVKIVTADLGGLVHYPATELVLVQRAS